jgi:alpha-beta hydrolase superfamily lysophospholipase
VTRVSPGGPAGLRRVEEDFAGSAGVRLFRRAWLPEEASRSVLLVHGFAEHSGRYEALGAWLARHGCAVHAYDQRGHGRADGRRGWVERFEDFLDDLDRMRTLVREAHPQLPGVVIGHSMGGLIVATWLRERHPDVAAGILSGPGLALGDAMPVWQLTLARAVRRFAGGLAVPSRLPLEGLCSDPEVIRRYQEDPLVFDKITVALAVEMFAAAERSVDGGADVRVPVLVLHGEDDPICDPQGSRRFHAGLTDPASELRLYPGLRHEIFNEPQAERVYADAVEWLEKQGL